jgi:hypothetical protein
MSTFGNRSLLDEQWDDAVIQYNTTLSENNLEAAAQAVQTLRRLIDDYQLRGNTLPTALLKQGWFQIAKGWEQIADVWVDRAVSIPATSTSGPSHEQGESSESKSHTSESASASKDEELFKDWAMAARTYRFALEAADDARRSPRGGGRGVDIDKELNARAVVLSRLFALLHVLGFLDNVNDAEDILTQMRDLATNRVFPKKGVGAWTSKHAKSKSESKSTRVSLQPQSAKPDTNTEEYWLFIAEALEYLISAHAEYLHMLSTAEPVKGTGPRRAKQVERLQRAIGMLDYFVKEQIRAQDALLELKQGVEPP